MVIIIFTIANTIALIVIGLYLVIASGRAARDRDDLRAIAANLAKPRDMSR